MGLFGMDPQRQQMLAMMLAGGFSGMAGQPRNAGWSAPLGGFSRGLASMMPYMMQMQQQQEANKALAQAEQQMYGALGPEMWPAALQAIQWQPPAQDLKQVYDPARGGMIWASESQAGGRPSDLPVSEQIKKAAAMRPPGQPRTPTELEQAIALRNSPDAMLRHWAQTKLSGGGATPTQAAGNAEIDAARRYLLDNNLTMDEIVRRTQETTSTGRDNNDYDPYLSKTFNLALQRKIGNDPEFETIQKRYRGVQTTDGGAGGQSGAGPLAGSGTQADPYAPQTDGDFDTIAPGEYYIDPGDGQLYQAK
jgi:hypothetical protein